MERGTDDNSMKATDSSTATLKDGPRGSQGFFEPQVMAKRLSAMAAGGKRGEGKGNNKVCVIVRIVYRES